MWSVVVRHVSTDDMTPPYPASSEPGLPGLAFTHRTSMRLWYIATTIGVGFDALDYGLHHVTLWWLHGPSPEQNTMLGLMFSSLAFLFTGCCAVFVYRSARHPERPLGSITAAGAIGLFAAILAVTSLLAGHGVDHRTDAVRAMTWWYFNPFTYLMMLPVARLVTDMKTPRTGMWRLAVTATVAAFLVPIVAFLV